MNLHSGNTLNSTNENEKQADLLIHGPEIEPYAGCDVWFFGLLVRSPRAADVQPRPARPCWAPQ